MGDRRSERSVASKKSRGSIGSRRSSNLKAGSSKSEKSSARSRAKVAVEENDAEMPASLTALHYEQLVRIYTMMSGCAQSGDEQKNSLVSAVYFAMKMVSSSVQLANFAAKQMHATRQEAAEKEGKEKEDFVCPFQVPGALSTWVPEQR